MDETSGLKIDICITSFNRDISVTQSFGQVLHHPFVNKIHVVDDASDRGFYKSLQFKIDRINSEFPATKVFLYRNEKNLDCYFNKREAVSKGTTERVIILDSDNVIDESYIEVIKKYKGKTNRLIVLQPEFARPHFDFRNVKERYIDRHNISTLIDDGAVQTMLNAMNYCVDREMYLEAFDETIDPVTSDSFYQNYNLMLHGCRFIIAEGMQYDHPISDDSHYKKNVKRTPKGFHDSIMKKFKELR